MGPQRKQNRAVGSLNWTRQFLHGEALALVSRIAQVRSFALNMPMVAAANISRPAQQGISEVLVKGKRKLLKEINRFIQKTKPRAKVRTKDIQGDFTVLKLKFNALLDQLDIFADVLTQRGEHQTGIWLAGLDALAKDALKVKGGFFKSPPLVCYLDRGHGAAIRRARTRLPGGPKNPVAVIRVPRERMVSNGIASSLVHEVGHQGSVLLGLKASIKRAIQAQAQSDDQHAFSWNLLDRWISEILSDFWSVASVGVTSTTGLIGVVSLPKYFVFRMNLDDPHPFPWIRVKISCAFGRALYPDPQWDRLEQFWEAAYPIQHLQARQKAIIRQLEKVIPKFVQLVVHHRPKKLKGKRLKEIFPIATRQPNRLRQLFRNHRESLQALQKFKPTMVFAIIGQARADHQILPKKEHELLTAMLQHWALKNQ